MNREIRSKIALAIAALVILWGFFPRESLAIPARDQMENLLQPDGTTIAVRQFGDEWNNGLRTHDGFTLLKDERTGYWMFAEDAPGGGVRRSNRIAGRHAPTGIRKFLRSGPTRAPALNETGDATAGPSAAGNLGGQPLLVIFADFTPSVRAGATAASLFNKFFGASGSVKDYYEKVSYGNFSITPAPETNVSLGGLINDGIVSVTLNYAHPNTGSDIDDRNRNITRDALIASNQFVDFSQFDLDGDGVLSPTELHIIIVVAGYERAYTSTPCGPSVWGHRWGLSGAVPAPVLDGKIVGRSFAQFGEWHCSSGSGSGHEATIGIMAHELGHDLGLPDLYDTDGSSQGIGNWSIMAGGSWNGIVSAGDSPAHFDPWSKFFEGWISPTVVNGTLANQAIGASAAAPNIYQLLAGTPASGEYFLIENRQRVNYDAALPATGLLIWHIDASKADNNAECFPGGPSCATSHYKTAVVPADSLFNLERNQNRGDAGDPWPGSTGNSNFSAISSPNSTIYSGAASGVSVTAIGPSAAVMTATLSGADNGPPDTTITGSPLALTNLTSANFTFASTKAGSTFACKFDAGAFASCASPTSYAGLAAGSHTFQVQATDQSSNTDPTPASFTWTIDTTAPDTSIASGPAGTITVNSATFNWSGSDNVTAPANLVYAYRLDPLEPSFSTFGVAASKTYTGLANGNYTFIVQSKDQAGNADLTPASRAFTVNVPAGNPTISLSFDGQNADRVGQAESALNPDGKLDGVFTVTLNPGSGNRTVTRLHLTNTSGGIWNTQGGDGFWSLGAANGVASPLLNASNDVVNFAAAEGNSFKIFAADSQNAMYLNGIVFTLTANFSDGSSASATATINGAPAGNPTISLSFDGQIADRVGQAESALNPDGKLDGVFTVTLNPGSGNRTVTRLHLTNTPGGKWNTQGGDGFWSLGVANGVASPLLNASNDVVNFAVAEGNSFKIFAADSQNAMYLNGIVFTLTANFSDGSSASATATINGAPAGNPTISISFDGQIADRVGQNEFALGPDGKLDGVFTVTLNPGSGNRTITRLRLTNTPGGIWNTQGSDGFWSLGVATGVANPLLNGANDAVSFALGEGSAFKIFAADSQNLMFVDGVVFNLTVNFSDGSSASANATVNGAGTVSSPAISLSYDGRLRDRMGEGELGAGQTPDGKLDGTFTVGLNTGSGNRTITRLELTNNLGGIWDTVGGDSYWLLGASLGLDGGLLNAGNDAVNFALADGGSFEIFAPDWQNLMFLTGVRYSLKANFSDGTLASASATIP